MLLLGQLPRVKVELLALQHVAVGASALTRPARNAGVHTSDGHLLVDSRIQLPVLVPRPQLALDVVALLLLHGLSRLRILLHADLNPVVLLVPLLERRGINRHDRILHQRLGTHQLVVGRIVHDIQDASLTRSRLRSPRKVPGIQTQRTELVVPPTDTNGTNAHVGRQLGVGSNTAQLVLTLLAPFILLASGGTTLMERVAGNT